MRTALRSVRLLEDDAEVDPRTLEELRALGLVHPRRLTVTEAGLVFESGARSTPRPTGDDDADSSPDQKLMEMLLYVKDWNNCGYASTSTQRLGKRLGLIQKDREGWRLTDAGGAWIAHPEKLSDMGD